MTFLIQLLFAALGVFIGIGSYANLAQERWLTGFGLGGLALLVLFVGVIARDSIIGRRRV